MCPSLLGALCPPPAHDSRKCVSMSTSDMQRTRKHAHTHTSMHTRGRILHCRVRCVNPDKIQEGPKSRNSLSLNLLPPPISPSLSPFLKTTTHTHSLTHTVFLTHTAEGDTISGTHDLLCPEKASATLAFRSKEYAYQS